MISRLTRRRLGIVEAILVVTAWGVIAQQAAAHYV